MSKPVAIIDDESILSRRLVRYGLIWGVWTIVALFFSTQVYVMNYAQRRPIRYAESFLVQAAACYLWALATPLVLWLSRRFRIERSNWLRRVFLHLLISVVLVSTLLALHFVIYVPLIGGPGITPFRLFNNVYYNLDKWLL